MPAAVQGTKILQQVSRNSEYWPTGTAEISELPCSFTLTVIQPFLKSFSKTMTKYHPFADYAIEYATEF